MTGQRGDPAIGLAVIVIFYLTVALIGQVVWAVLP